MEVACFTNNRQRFGFEPFKIFETWTEPRNRESEPFKNFKPFKLLNWTSADCYALPEREERD